MKNLSELIDLLARAQAALEDTGDLTDKDRHYLVEDLGVARDELIAERDKPAEDGLRAAALIAERMRDAYHQRGRFCEASAADEVRVRIQYEIDHPAAPAA
jgi:hypothetical protein